MTKFPDQWEKPQAKPETSSSDQGNLIISRKNNDLYRAADLGKDLLIGLLPWQKQEAVRLGWKFTKFIAGKK